MHDGRAKDGALIGRGEPIQAEEKNPHGMSRKARRAQASDYRRAARGIRKAIANLERLIKR